MCRWSRAFLVFIVFFFEFFLIISSIADDTHDRELPRVLSKWKQIEKQIKENKNLATKENCQLFETAVRTIINAKRSDYTGFELNYLMALSKPYLEYKGKSRNLSNDLYVAMALFFSREYQKSANVLDNILMSQPDNYGGLLMAGCLSIMPVNSKACVPLSWKKAFDIHPYETLIYSQRILPYLKLLSQQNASKEKEFDLIMFNCMKQNKSWWETNPDRLCAVKYFVFTKLYQLLNHSGLINPDAYENPEALNVKIAQLKKEKVFAKLNALGVGLVCQMKFQGTVCNTVCISYGLNLPGIILKVSGLEPETLIINLSEGTINKSADK